jgi:hypothetical protein
VHGGEAGRVGRLDEAGPPTGRGGQVDDLDAFSPLGKGFLTGTVDAEMAP